jgi:hypothetical protein
MARYFKYNPQQYESMFVPLPLDLFAAKLQGEQGKFDALEQASQQVQDQWRSLQVDFYDEEKRDKKIAEMKQEFSDVIDNSKGDVNQMYSELNRLNRDWNEYTTMGHGAAMTQSLVTIQEARKKYDEAVAKKDKTEASRWAEFLNKYRQWGESGGTKPSEGGNYTTFGYNFGSPDFDSDKWHKEIALPGWNVGKDSIITGDGRYKWSYSIEELTGDRVRTGLRNDLYSRDDFDKTTYNKFRYGTKDYDASNMVNLALTGEDKAGNKRYTGLYDRLEQINTDIAKYKKEGNNDAVSVLESQAKDVSGMISDIENSTSFEEKVGKATDYAYAVFKDNEVNKTMALALEKLPYKKESRSDLIIGIEGEKEIRAYENALKNPNTPILETNVSNITPEILSAHVSDAIEKANKGDLEAFSTLTGTVGTFFNKLVTSGASASTPGAILNRFNTIAKDNPDKNVADVFALMTRESLDMSKEEFAKAYNIAEDAITDDMWAQTQETAAADWSRYNIANAQKESFETVSNSMAITLVDDNGRYLVKGMHDIDQQIRATEHDIWAANYRISSLQKASKTRPLTNREQQQIDNDKKFIAGAQEKVSGLKTQLQGYASEHPDEVITTYIEQSGDISGVTEMLYGSALTSTGGGIKVVNDTYEAQFKGKPVSELIANGALADYKDILEDDEDAVVESVTIMDAPLGMGNGYMTMVLKSPDGKMVTRVVNLDASSNAAAVGLYGFAANIQSLEREGVQSPLNSTKQEDLARNYTWYGKTKFGNALQPAKNEKDVQYVTSPSTGLVVMVKPVKLNNGSIKYELYSRDEKGDYTISMPSKNGYNAYGDINAVNESLGRYDYNVDVNKTYVVPGTSRTPKGYYNETE